MQSLEPAFVELQKKNSKLTKDPIINLIHTVTELKDLCVKIKDENDKSGLWDKFKNVISANSNLKQLADLNERLTKVQADLQIPLQVEEGKKIDQMFDYLKNVMEKGQNVYNAALTGKSVNTLAKKFLTNEEAFAFWMGKEYFS